MLRPIQRVYPLEVQSTETSDDPLNDCTFTSPISSISSDMPADPNDSSSVLGLEYPMFWPGSSNSREIRSLQSGSLYFLGPSDADSGRMLKAKRTISMTHCGVGVNEEDPFKDWTFFIIRTFVLVNCKLNVEILC
ncbi:hypothetical protein TNIN_403591 [Trichonephila inaurata madagascariensis]|uniref:Uncharacterized protein n=1 Tax=Trichonephila inaurata madagascariensis TaxID=2747483 RepID=A0A8X7CID3_9ARAC|nr:hypothetical protein TNIN_403591 [Trichonephila inaurata madagascariensis]